MAEVNATVELSSLASLKPTKNSGKWQKLPISKLKVAFDLNIRFRKGQLTFGVNVEADTYDLATMKMQIIDAGCILEDIWVSERENGDLIVLRGNRRTIAGQELEVDPSTPESVRLALQSVPVRVFKNLTQEQEMELVEDQGQKAFLRSETVQHVWRLLGKGWGFERIAMTLFEVFGKFSGNARKVAEIRAIPAEDVASRRTAIKKWLRGTLDEYIIPAYKLGSRVMKNTLLSEMHLDGILPPTAAKPEWYTTKNPQKRMAELEKAKKSDGATWNHHTGGKEFNAVIEKFKAEDFPDPSKINPNATPAVKRLTVAELNSRAESSRSSVAKMAFRIATGATEDTFQIRDEFLSLIEAKEMLAMQYLTAVKDDATVSVIDAIRAFITMESVTDFEAWLQKYSNPLQTPEPEQEPEVEAQDESSDTTEEVA